MSENPEVLKTLASIPWLMEASKDQKIKLEKIAGFRYLGEGEVLFQEGDKDNLLYIILEGSLRVTTFIPEYGETQLYDAEPLDVVGWETMAPVARQRITSVVALNKSNLLYFNGKALDNLCEEDKALGYLFMRRITNVIAARMLAMRLKLFTLVIKK